MQNSYTLITGANGGIGYATVKEIQDRPLILVGRNQDALDSLRMTLDTPQIHQTIQADLSTHDGIQAFIERLKTTNLNINAFVHIAGICYLAGAKNFNYNNMLEMMNVNIFSALEIIRILSRKPFADFFENTVLLSSISAKRGVKSFALYAASKNALEAIVRGFAIELAPKVRINAIAPGMIFDTKMTGHLYSQAQKKYIENEYPLGTGTPEDIANTISFLLSSKSKWITGQTLTVDGGNSIKG